MSGVDLGRREVPRNEEVNARGKSACEEKKTQEGLRYDGLEASPLPCHNVPFGQDAEDQSCSRRFSFVRIKSSTNTRRGDVVEVIKVKARDDSGQLEVREYS